MVAISNVFSRLSKAIGSLPHQAEKTAAASEENASETIPDVECSRHIVLFGAIANPNVGDEAILDNALTRIDDVFGQNASVSILSQNAQYTEQFLHLHTCKAHASDALRALTARFPQDLDALMVTEANIINRLKGADCFAYVDGETLKLYDEVIAQFKDIDVLHVIGGGYMNSMWPHMFFEVHVATRIAEEKNAQIILTGQSMSPLDATNQAHTKLLSEIVMSADLCDFRDDSAKDVKRIVATSHPVRTVDDLAIYVEEGKTTDTNDAYGNITLVGLLGPATAEQHRKAHEHVLDVLSEFLSLQFQEGRIHHVNLLSFSPGDEGLLSALRESAPSKIHLVTLHNSPSKDAFAIVQGARWNLGERFHHAVFSMAAEVPCMSWWHNGYYENKLISAYEAWGFTDNSVCMPEDQLTLEKLIAFVSDENTLSIKTKLSQNKANVTRRYAQKEAAILHAYEAQ